MYTPRIAPAHDDTFARPRRAGHTVRVCLYIYIYIYIEKGVGNSAACVVGVDRGDATVRRTRVLFWI